MRFSLWLWPYDRWGSIKAMADVAYTAETLGFANVTVSDHTIVTTGPESLGLTKLWPDWAVLTTYLASRTSTIGLVATVVIPYRSPIVTAKQAATIDHVSGGRFTLAAASGWLHAEFAALGVPHAKRGRITDEYLHAIKALWTEPRPTFSGEYVDISNVFFEPKCVQAPHVPIWIAGGSASGPVRRLAELGDGWMPMGGGLDSRLRETVQRVKEHLECSGRDTSLMIFRYTIGIGEPNSALVRISEDIGGSGNTAVARGNAEEVAEEIARYEAAGFNELALNLPGVSLAELTEQLEWFGEAVMPLVGDGVGHGPFTGRP